jgi:tetratricopeptide (TPR) repeat protein
MKILTFIAAGLLLGCSFGSSAAQEASLDSARGLLNRGSYKEAIAAFKTLIARNAEDADALNGLIRAEIETGEYSSAEKRAREFLAGHATSAGIRTQLAETYLLTGRYSEAATEAERAAKEGKPPVSVRALLTRVRALAAQGKEDEAKATAGQIIQAYSETAPRSAEEITLLARAAVYLEKYRDANELFIDAREAESNYVEAFIAQGELLNEKYSYTDAASLFGDALKLNQNSVAALLGLAGSKQDSSGEASSLVDRALQVNPNSVEALALRARFDLEHDKADAAKTAIEKALAVDPNSIQVRGIRAATLFLSDKPAELDAEIRKALAINPRAGEFFETLAHFAVINRRYEEAVEFEKKAVELSPRVWSARTELGIQLLRVGRIAEGRAELERTFAGDPFNVWAKNSLDLLDSMRDYVDTLRGPFIVRASAKENGVLGAYAADLLEEAHKKLTTRYRFTPKAPISVEVFANHEDFAVRSLGLPGLGALGVCFGQVIAMDSPAARNPGEFNWGSTLWHEFAHVITLQITNHRIPRWFSEGLSVYEERRARPGWGDNWSMQNLAAVKAGKMVGISDLDGQFTRPRTPDGVAVAYFQASQICEFLDEKYGFDSILKMLALYKEGIKTPEVLQRALQLTPDGFDKAFEAFVKAKTGAWMQALGSGLVQTPAATQHSKDDLLTILKTRPDDYAANLRLGAVYKTEGDTDRALTHLRKAAELFPYYAAENGPYWLMADVYEAKGQKKEAADALEAMLSHNETSPAAPVRLAQLKLALGDKSGAAEALRHSFYVQPFDVNLHKLAGGVYLELGNARAAITEFRVVVALAPADAAEAHYDLARALDAGGNRTEAKREVLKALEIAPGFEKAQELLLKLRTN